MSNTSEMLRQRLIDVAEVGLADMLRRAPKLRTMSPALMTCFENWSPTDSEDIEAWSHYLTGGMTRYLTTEFQYLDIAGAPVPLAAIYRRFLADLWQERHSVGGATLALASHHDRLHTWLTDRLAEASALEPVMNGFSPVCARYRPETQLAILGLDVGKIAAPVLDIGCGDGRLVRHLRAAGIEATGIDQSAGDGLLCGDWFQAPLQPGRWGTIIAHQSVSLHFQHAHLHSERRAKRYATLFLRILDALKPGGTFAYAPAVPFFEGLLRERGTIDRRERQRGAVSTIITVAT